MNTTYYMFIIIINMYQNKYKILLNVSINNDVVKCII